MQQNFIENSLIILTKQTMDKFLEYDNAAELIALYTFYYYTAKWQNTNHPKCTSDYVAKGLHWNRNKVIRVKKQLLEFGLIEDIRMIDQETKKVMGHYIKMNYIFKKETVDETQCTQKPPTGYGVLEASVPKSEGVDFKYTNALSTNNINALSTNNIRKKERKKRVPKKENKISFNDIIEEYTQNEQLRSELKEHLKTRKAKKAPVTNRALILSLNKLDTLANTDEEKIIIVQNSIMNGWTGFFNIQSPNKKTQIPERYRIPTKEEYDEGWD